MRVPSPLPNGLPLRFANATQNRDVDGWLSLSLFKTVADPLNASSDTDVSRETVATSAYEGTSPRANRRESGHGDQTRAQAQELMAFVSYPRHALRDAEQVAGATGTTFAQTTLVRPRSASRNRLMRTRMSGCAGRTVSDGGPYAISAIVSPRQEK